MAAIRSYRSQVRLRQTHHRGSRDLCSSDLVRVVPCKIQRVEVWGWVKCDDPHSSPSTTPQQPCNVTMAKQNQLTLICKFLEEICLRSGDTVDSHVAAKSSSWQRSRKSSRVQELSRVTQVTTHDRQTTLQHFMTKLLRLAKLTHCLVVQSSISENMASFLQFTVSRSILPCPQHEHVLRSRA